MNLIKEKLLLQLLLCPLFPSVFMYVHCLQHVRLKIMSFAPRTTNFEPKLPPAIVRKCLFLLVKGISESRTFSSSEDRYCHAYTETIKVKLICHTHTFETPLPRTISMSSKSPLPSSVQPVCRPRRDLNCKNLIVKQSHP